MQIGIQVWQTIVSVMIAKLIVLMTMLKMVRVNNMTFRCSNCDKIPVHPDNLADALRTNKRADLCVRYGDMCEKEGADRIIQEYWSWKDAPYCRLRDWAKKMSFEYGRTYQEVWNVVNGHKIGNLSSSD